MDNLEQALTNRSLSVLDRLKIACHLWKNASQTQTVFQWTCDQICLACIDKKKSNSVNKELILSLFKFLFVILKTISSNGKWVSHNSMISVHIFEVRQSLKY